MEEKLSKENLFNSKAFPFANCLIIKGAGIAAILTFANGISNLYPNEVLQEGCQRRIASDPSQIRSSRAGIKKSVCHQGLSYKAGEGVAGGGGKPLFVLFGFQI